HLLRGEHQLELDAEIARWTRGQTVDELLGVLDKAGVPAGRIYTAPDILGDPHYRARDMVVEVPDPSLDGESVPMPGVVPKLSRTPGAIRRGAPLLGEHNDEILGALRTTSAGRR
ncbi:CoA transferase, partial [Streptomyces hirsutus]